LKFFKYIAAKIAEYWMPMHLCGDNNHRYSWPWSYSENRSIGRM